MCFVLRQFRRVLGTAGVLDNIFDLFGKIQAQGLIQGLVAADGVERKVFVAHNEKLGEQAAGPMNESVDYFPQQSGLTYKVIL